MNIQKISDDLKKRGLGSCPICSFHRRFGVNSGYVTPGAPVDRHQCPNQNMEVIGVEPPPTPKNFLKKILDFIG